LWLNAWTGAMDSTTVWDFPPIFPEFRKKQFSLLWRGSRDGFNTQEFHRRCDHQVNTLTVILDTKGNVFGGFTPRGWGEARDSDLSDDILKCFIFTLKNPHGMPAKRFALKAEMKYHAIDSNPEYGPSFGWDIHVSDHCNANAASPTYLGAVYTNDPGLGWATVSTGSLNFQVREIEVFEITESMAFPAKPH
jgi:hypothetical protein